MIRQTATLGVLINFTAFQLSASLLKVSFFNMLWSLALQVKTQGNLSLLVQFRISSVQFKNACFLSIHIIWSLESSESRSRRPIWTWELIVNNFISLYSSKTAAGEQRVYWFQTLICEGYSQWTSCRVSLHYFCQLYTLCMDTTAASKDKISMFT